MCVNMRQCHNSRNLDTYCSLQWHMTVVWVSTGVTIAFSDPETGGTDVQQWLVRPEKPKMPISLARAAEGVAAD